MDSTIVLAGVIVLGLAVVVAFRSRSTSSGGDVLRVLRDEVERLRISNESSARALRQEVLDGMTAMSGTSTTAINQSLTGINETLRQLHGSIGEVQALRSDVGDLRKVFSNVKSRGGWGEVQIESILEDVLQSSQYCKNFEARPGSGQRVEVRGEDARRCEWR